MFWLVRLIGRLVPPCTLLQRFAEPVDLVELFTRFIVTLLTFDGARRLQRCRDIVWLSGHDRTVRRESEHRLRTWAGGANRRGPFTSESLDDD